MKILITSGPTREPIDGVRFITNLSSGRTGREMAEYFSRKGHEVIFLYGKNSEKPVLQTASRPPVTFETFQDLNTLLQKILREETFDVVIHLAAVGDYSIQSVKAGVDFYSEGKKGKIDSSHEVTVTLRKNFKILERIKSYAKDHSPRVIGFKLTHSADKEVWKSSVDKVYANTLGVKSKGDNPVDLVVHNDISDMSETAHSFRIMRQNHLTIECASAEALSQSLESLLLGGQP